MSDQPESEKPMMVVRSSRFGDLTVPVDSVIDFPAGVIGFPQALRFVMLDHKPPFSWLQSCEDPNLAFVVVDGGLFAEKFPFKAPVGDRDIDLKPDDEFAILVIVTVRPDPTMTTANLKAPLFVNIRNRKGTQIIFDDPNFSTRYPLWVKQDEEKKEGEKKE